MRSIICLWAGAIADIPSGWHLCDGTLGTPDLRDKFVIGAGNTYSPDDTQNTNVATNAGVAFYALAFIIKL